MAAEHLPRASLVSLNELLHSQVLSIQECEGLMARECPDAWRGSEPAGSPRALSIPEERHSAVPAKSLPPREDSLGRARQL